MDYIYLIMLLVFSLVMLFVGFRSKQSVLVVLSGIGLMLIGVFFFMGVTYTTGEITTVVPAYACGCCSQGSFMWGGACTSVQVVNETTTVTKTTDLWASTYNPYLSFFFMLTGLFCILAGIVDFLKVRNKFDTGTDDDGDED
jgi:hypothetical protein